MLNYTAKLLGKTDDFKRFYPLPDKESSYRKKLSESQEVLPRNKEEYEQLKPYARMMARKNRQNIVDDLFSIFEADVDGFPETYELHSSNKIFTKFLERKINPKGLGYFVQGDAHGLFKAQENTIFTDPLTEGLQNRLDTFNHEGLGHAVEYNYANKRKKKDANAVIHDNLQHIVVQGRFVDEENNSASIDTVHDQFARFIGQTIGDVNLSDDEYRAHNYLTRHDTNYEIPARMMNFFLMTGCLPTTSPIMKD